MSEQNLVVDETLECSGMLCPMPVVKTAMAIKRMDIGQVLKMTATDAGSPPDIAAWAHQTKNELLESRQEGDKFIFFIRRTN